MHRRDAAGEIAHLDASEPRLRDHLRERVLNRKPADAFGKVAIGVGVAEVARRVVQAFGEVVPDGGIEFLARAEFADVFAEARPELVRVFGRWRQLGEYTSSPRRVFTFSPEGSRNTFGEQWDEERLPVTP